MRYQTIWDQATKLWFVVDRFKNFEKLSLHWTSGEALKRAMMLEQKTSPAAC